MKENNLLKIIAKIFIAAKNYIDGNFSYENYLTHHKKNHPQQQALSKKTFLQNCQKEKWSKVNRCC